MVRWRQGSGSRTVAASIAGRLRRMEMACLAASFAMTPQLVRPQETVPRIAPVWTLQSRLYATDNGAYTDASNRRGDLAVWLSPGVNWQHLGPRLQVNLDAHAALTAFARNSQSASARPDLRATVKSELIEDWLSFDAGARVFQTQDDVFGPQAGNALEANSGRRTERIYTLSPHLERRFSPTTLGYVRYEASLDSNGPGVGSRVKTTRGAAGIEIAPMPFGAALKWERVASGDPTLAESRIAIASLRASGSARLSDSLVAALSAGQDQSRYLSTAQDSPAFGAGLQWIPGPRTGLSASVEHRFFGIGGRLALKHRNPMWAFSLALRREPVTPASALGSQGSGGDIRSFLDSILTTRHPDAAVRRGIVDDWVADMASSTVLPSATGVAAAYPQLQSRLDTAVTWLGRRSTVTASGYWASAQQLSDRTESSPVPAAISDTRQMGIELNGDHRLTGVLTAGALCRWSRTVGLATRAGDASTESLCRVTLSRRLTPQTSVSVGAQVDNFSTTVAGLHAYRANMLFVGYDQRF